MKKFYFRLETPLRIKQLKEKIERQKLSQAILKKRTEENRLYKMNILKENTRKEFDKIILTSAEIRDLSYYSVFDADMSFLIESQKNVVKQAQEAYERCTNNFISSRRERQIYEKIKEHQYKEYNMILNREEQKITDELGNINYSRLGEETT